MRVFRASRDSQRRKPVKFQVGDEAFSVPLPLPGVAMLDLASAFSEEDESKAASAISDYMTTVLPEGDYPRFRAALTTERLPLFPDDMDAIEDEPSILGIVFYVMKEATGVPLDTPSPSAPRRKKTGSR